MVGVPRLPEGYKSPDLDDLLRLLTTYGIGIPLIRHRQCVDNDPYWGNNLLYSMGDKLPRNRLVPCVTPDGPSPDFDVAAYVSKLRQSGIRAFWIAPRHHQYSALPWCSHRLYKSLIDTNSLLLVEYDQITADDLNCILTEYPDLLLLMLHAPRLGRNRLIYPLMQRHPKLLLCLNYAYSVQNGWEDILKLFGPERFLWGMGYPQAEIGASLMPLLFGNFSESARAAVGGDNLKRLIGESMIH